MAWLLHLTDSRPIAAAVSHTAEPCRAPVTRKTFERAGTVNPQLRRRAGAGGEGPDGIDREVHELVILERALRQDLHVLVPVGYTRAMCSYPVGYIHNACPHVSLHVSARLDKFQTHTTRSIYVVSMPTHISSTTCGTTVLAVLREILVEVLWDDRHASIVERRLVARHLVIVYSYRL